MSEEKRWREGCGVAAMMEVWIQRVGRDEGEQNTSTAVEMSNPC